MQENAFENVVCKMAAILSRPQCVKWMDFEFPSQGNSKSIHLTHWVWDKIARCYSRSLLSQFTLQQYGSGDVSLRSTGSQKVHAQYTCIGLENLRNTGILCDVKLKVSTNDESIAC